MVRVSDSGLKEEVSTNVVPFSVMVRPEQEKYLVFT